MDGALKLLAACALCAVRTTLGLVHVFLSSVIQAAAGLWRDARADCRRIAERPDGDNDVRGG
jgi:hypothetical protein